MTPLTPLCRSLLINMLWLSNVCSPYIHAMEYIQLMYAVHAACDAVQYSPCARCWSTVPLPVWLYIGAATLLCCTAERLHCNAMQCHSILYCGSTELQCVFTVVQCSVTAFCIVAVLNCSASSQLWNAVPLHSASRYWMPAHRHNV